MYRAISKYVLKEDLGSETILFNTNGGALVSIDSAALRDDNINLQYFTDAQIEKLKKMNMLFQTDDLDATSFRDCDSITISIELLGACNFNCVYCYQSPWDSRPEISYETLDTIASYIKKIAELQPDTRVLHLNFIGGEPLLAKGKLLYMYSKVRDILATTGIQLAVAIDTNGSLIDIEFLQAFKDPLYLSVTLSCEEDHNRMRPYVNGHESYKTITTQLLMCADIIRERGIELAIRYNTHDKNINEFDTFLKELKNLGLPILTVNPMYTREVAGNSFKNYLSYQDYVTWNSTTAIDILVDNGYEIYYFPQTILRLCKAYQHYCYKFFSDGSIGLCDATLYEKGMPNIHEYAYGPQQLEKTFSKFKEYNPIADDECKSCSNIYLCGGKYFCKENPCNEQLFDDRLFILKFIEHSNKGNARFFVKAFNKANSKHA